MKKIILLLVCLLLVVGCTGKSTDNKKVEENKIDMKKEVSSYYNKYVVTKEESKLYDKDYKEVGSINKDVKLILDDVEITEDTRYFKIANTDYYIKYNVVNKIEKFEIDKRYKRYVVFNQNIVTTDSTTFYKDDNYVYKINSGVSLPIIIKNGNKYYVEYNNELVYVLKNEVKVVNHKNTSQKTRTNIRTFTYHAVYKPGETCKNKSICHPYKQFDEHMKYLHDNNYLTLTMTELEWFLDKKINIPTKTVVITLDDGNLAKNAIEILDKYELHATYFIITGRYNSYKLESKYVDFECHSDNLHNNYKCPGGQQGGQLLCEKESKVVADLKLSQEKLGGSHYFAYPFFDFNDRAKRILKQQGFRLAFIGQWNSEGYSTFNTDRYMIRRKTIFSTDSLNVFKSYLK